MELRYKNICLAGIILFGLICGILSAVPPMTLYPSVGTSMEPTIIEGDYVAVAPLGIEQMAIGDIIVYRSPLQDETGDFPLIVHRIVDMQHGIVRTKGDNRTAIDPFDISPERVQGKVMFIVPRRAE
ncbi:MAG: signal peptidase I [Methanomicrobiales archaeon]|nr:signal peptidase I [Methanomicrobiales archaeon]